MTRAVIDCLRKQVLDESLRIIVINDGSTDGTAQYLAAQTDVTVLNGNGDLWWAGAIDLGLKRGLVDAPATDWVAFVNNDTRFGPDFLQSLLDAARAGAPAAVGSVICDENAQEMLLSIGPMIHPWRLAVYDKLSAQRRQDPSQPVHEVGALSGRGTFYPLAAIRAAGGMRPKLLPHYLADYELAARVKRAGYRLIVSEKAVTFSENSFGNSREFASRWQMYFSNRSPHYFPAVVCFWWSARPPLRRWLQLPRLVYIRLREKLREKRST
jgi:GT2 family glycosyltransferase